MICIKCNEEKRPASFYTGSNWCKECYKARQRAYKQRRVYVAPRAKPLEGFSSIAQAFCLRKI